MSSRYILESGMRKRIGDGKTVKIWKDRWLPEGRERKVRSVVPEDGGVQKVSDLIKNGEWDLRLLRASF